MELTPEKMKALEELTGWTPDKIAAVNKRVEERQLKLTPEEEEAIERQVDESFIKLTGRTYREPLPLSAGAVIEAAKTDSLDQIVKDFPELFGEPGDAGR